MNTVNQSWLSKVPMKRIILHWTAGTYTPNKTDLAAYHFVIDGDGRWHKGVDVAKNSGSLKGGYAAHTLNLNTDSIGVSLACMAGAVEVPFNAGKYPMRREQVDSLVEGVRELVEFYNIPVGPKTVLSHAEVQGTLGVQQRNKWDYTRLPFDPDVRGAKAIGDLIRARVTAATLRGPQVMVSVGEPLPARSVLEVITPATTSTEVGGGGATGSIPAGFAVALIEQQGSRVRVETPGGYRVWADVVAFRLLGEADQEDNAVAASTRGLIADIRGLLDKLEQAISET